MLACDEKRQAAVIELGLVRESRFRGFTITVESDPTLCAVGAGWGYSPPVQTRHPLDERLRVLLRKEPEARSIAERIVYFLAVCSPGTPFQARAIASAIALTVDSGHVTQTLIGLVEKGCLHRVRCLPHERPPGARGHLPWVYWADAREAVGLAPERLNSRKSTRNSPLLSTLSPEKVC